MTDIVLSKRELILDTAKSLFIEKGFRGTTISGIATSAGIAKGSVYSYFNSKSDIVKALFLKADEKDQYLVEELLTDNNNTGQLLLEQYLALEFQEVLNERSFIQVFLTDDLIILNEELMQVVQECRINYHLSQQKVLLQAYGSDISPWLYDIVSVVNGLLQEYTIYLTIDDANFSIKQCAHLIAFILDNTISAFNASTLTPVLTKENFPLTKDTNIEQLQNQKAKGLIENIKIETFDLNAEQKKLIQETLTLISDELSNADLNRTLIRALIANLRPYTELNAFRRKLADALDVELI